MNDLKVKFRRLLNYNYSPLFYFQQPMDQDVDLPPPEEPAVDSEMTEPSQPATDDTPADPEEPTTTEMSVEEAPENAVDSAAAENAVESEESMEVLDETVKTFIKEEPSEEVPPVVMTTTDLDGNAQDNKTVPTSLPAPNRIRINITKTVLPGNIVKAIEPTDEASSSPKRLEEEAKAENSDGKAENSVPIPLNQPKSVKPLIASKNMTHYPPLKKGKDLSALCSIM